MKDEVFDWDLSDKTDCETQTVPPTRANSTLGGGIIYSYTANFDLQFQDAIVQTDQRLAFLLRSLETEQLVQSCFNLFHLKVDAHFIMKYLKCVK